MKNYLIYLFFIVFISSCNSQSNVISDYFPLNKGDVYEYRGKFEGKEYHKSNIVRTFNISNNMKVYYFHDATEKNDIVFFGANMIGNGMYTFVDNRLWTIEASNSFDFYNLDFEKKQMLLPENLEVRSEVSLNSTYNKAVDTIQVVAYEDIRVPYGEFKDCLKLKITKVWNHGQRDESYAWFAKNIGLIKWIKITGRVDELVNYLPK